MTRWRLRSAGLAWREIDGEAVVVDVPESLYLAANAAGTVLWRALADGASVQSLSALLVERYGIEAEQADADADAFVAELVERNLVVASDE